MATYYVTVLAEVILHVEADSEEEAGEMAVAEFTSDCSHDLPTGPKVMVVEEAEEE